MKVIQFRGTAHTRAGPSTATASLVDVCHTRSYYQILKCLGATQLHFPLRTSSSRAPGGSNCTAHPERITSIHMLPV